MLEPATVRGCHQGLLGSKTCFAGILEGIKDERRDKSCHVAVAITKPPETVSFCCMSCMSFCVRSAISSAIDWESNESNA